MLPAVAVGWLTARFGWHVAAYLSRPSTATFNLQLSLAHALRDVTRLLQFADVNLVSHRPPSLLLPLSVGRSDRTGPAPAEPIAFPGLTDAAVGELAVALHRLTALLAQLQPTVAGDVWARLCEDMNDLEYFGLTATQRLAVAQRMRRSYRFLAGLV